MLDGFFPIQTERKTIRPHQAEAIRLLRLSLGKGNRRVVIQAPTGAGKTFIAARIIEGALAKGNSVIFTAPMVSLINQTVESFEAEGIRGIGVMQANHPRTDRLARVQVASVQTLSRREAPSAALVIVDEAHLRAAVIDRLMEERPDAFFVGLSATPWAKGMGRHWQDLVIPCTIGSLIDAGLLSRFSVFAPDVPDLSGVKVERGDYVEGQLADVMGDAKIVGNVVENWLARGDARPTLAFGVNRAHAAVIHRQFERAGVASAYVDGNTDAVEREVIARRFRSGEVQVIASVRTMTTGVDLPVSCIIDAAPTKSEMLHIQKLGRGLRVNPGTEDLVVFDHAGNALRLGLPTDIHHDRLDGSKPGQKGESKPKDEKLPKPCGKCEVLFVGRACPACGAERSPARIEEAEGELVEITGRKPKSSTADKQRFWSMALWIDAERGKGGRLAKALYKGKFDVWPRGLSDVTTPPDPAFLAYEHSRRIAYAKRRRAA